MCMFGLHKSFHAFDKLFDVFDKLFDAFAFDESLHLQM